MSFSSNVKHEIAHEGMENHCCARAELAALFHTAGTICLGGHKQLSIQMETESAIVARRAYSLLKRLYGVHSEILVKKNKRLRKSNHYILKAEEQAPEILLDLRVLYPDGEGARDIHADIDSVIIGSYCCRRAYLRGAYLAGGSVSDPERSYHLEIVTHSAEHAQSLMGLVQLLEMNAKVVERKKNYVVYLKESEQIVRFLNLIGAHTALFSFENTRIMKDMRNSVNRVVNCETANLSKTVDAAMRQVRQIEYIRDTMGLQKLPPSLRQVAEARLSNKEASLQELGNMLSPTLGKSGVNHRLRKLAQWAEDLRNHTLVGSLKKGKEES